jgi:hypothetical protein
MEALLRLFRQTQGSFRLAERAEASATSPKNTRAGNRISSHGATGQPETPSRSPVSTPAAAAGQRDTFETSPLSRLKTFFQQASSQSSLQSLSIEGVISESTDSLVSQDPQLQRELDLMLRLISKDDRDYERLKQQFQRIFQAGRGDREQQTKESRQLEATFARIAEFAAQKEQERSVDIARTQIQRTEVRMEFRKVNGRWEYQEVQIQQGDPLILDLEGNGVSPTQAADGAMFDLTGNGLSHKTAWVRGDDAFLFWDRNDNGLLDDGTELFGDQRGAAHGFAELARYDDNRDGVISSQDQIFKALRLYRDLNGNRRVEAAETQTLEQHGITALNLRFDAVHQKQGDNTFLLSGSFQRSDGSTGLLADYLLGYR